MFSYSNKNKTKEATKMVQWPLYMQSKLVKLFKTLKEF